MVKKASPNTSGIGNKLEQKNSSAESHVLSKASLVDSRGLELAAVYDAQGIEPGQADLASVTSQWQKKVLKHSDDANFSTNDSEGENTEKPFEKEGVSSSQDFEDDQHLRALDSIVSVDASNNATIASTGERFSEPLLSKIAFTEGDFSATSFFFSIPEGIAPPPILDEVIVDTHTPVLEGQLEDPNSDIHEVVVNGTPLDLDVVNENDDGSFTLDLSDTDGLSPLLDGQNTIEVTVIDADGVERLLSWQVTVDREFIEGIIEPFSTRDLQPEIHGTVSSAQARVVIEIAGEQYEAENHGNGTWTLTEGVIAPLQENHNLVNVHFSDGERSGESSASIHVDTTAPFGNVESRVSSDMIPAIEGSVNDPRAQVDVEIGGRSYQAINNANGTWQLPVNMLDEVPYGLNAVSVIFTDELGNVSSVNGIVDINLVPRAEDDQALTREDHSIEINVLDNDSDIDGDQLRVQTARADNGSVSITDDGHLRYTPAENFNGVDRIEYTIVDPAGNTDTAEVSIEVAAENDAPIVIDESAEVTAGQPLDIDVLANDTDIEGQPLSIASLSANNGSVSLNGDGSIRYTADVNYSGVDHISYVVSDGAGGTTTGQVVVQVNTAVEPYISIESSSSTNDNTPVLSGSSLNISGELSITIGTQTYTVTPAADGQWQLDWPDVLGDGTYSVSVSGTSSEGLTAQTNASILVDTQATGLIYLDSITADDIINAAESNQIVTVTGSVGGDAAPGDTVSMQINGVFYEGFVEAGNTFNIDVVGADLAADTSFSAVVSGSDGLGNSFVASTTTTHTVDTTANASIAVDPITADDIINAEEALQQIAVTGSVGGDAQVGDNVSLLINGTNYLGTVDTDGRFSIDVAGADLAADTTVEATVAGTDDAGNAFSETNISTHIVNISAEASISVDNITADDIINALEAGQTIAVTGSVGGDAAQGDSVSMMVNGVSYSGSVDASGNFSIDVAGSDLVADTSFTVSVSGTDDSGNDFNVSTISSHQVDMLAEGSIAVDSVTADDIVNAVEAAQDIAITGFVGGDAEAGDLVSFTVNGSNYNGVVAADLSFSVDVAGSDLAAQNTFDVFVTGSDALGNLFNASTTSVHAVDTSVFASIVVDNITSDDILNANESGQTVSVTGFVGGDASEGDIVRLNINGNDYSTQVTADLRFSVDVSGADLLVDTSFIANISGADDAGNLFSVDTLSTHTIDTQASATIFVNDITSDDLINAAEAGQNINVSGQVTGDVSTGDIVSFNINGNDYNGTVDASGNFSILVSGADLALDNSFLASVSVSDPAGNTYTATTLSTHLIDTQASATIVVDDITSDDILNLVESGQTISVTGSVSGDASEGDIVSLDINGTTYQGSVDASGNYSINVLGSDLAAQSSFTASVTGTDNVGNVFNANTLATYSVDVTAPTTTTNNLSLSNDTGASASDFIVNSANQTISANLSAPLATGESLWGSIDSGVSWTDISASVSGSNISWTGVTLTGSSSIQIKVVDAAGNDGPVLSQNYIVDTEAPVISAVSIADGNYIIGDTLNLTITVANAETGLSLTSAVFNGQNLTNITDNGDGTYSAEYIVQAGDSDVLDGADVNVSLGFTDVAGNIGTTISTVTLNGESIDANAPSLNISSSDDDLTSTETATITFAFSEAVVGFTSGDIIVTGASLGVISTSDGGVTYTATLTPDTEYDGNISISVADNTYTDADGNNGTGDSLVIESSTDTPTLAISSDDTNLVAGETATITFTFSEAVTGFVDGDISVSGGSLGAILTSDGGITYTATLTPDVEYDGNISVSVADNTYTDADGNNGTGDSLIIESSTDTSTLTISSDDANLVAGETATITFTFSEAASGFTDGDISVTGGSLGAISTLDGGITYTATLTPDAEYDGNISISVADNTYTDADGNNGTGDSLIVESSTDTPTLTISSDDANLVAGETATITFTFSEAASGFTDGDISVTGGSLGAISTLDGGVTYTATLTPDAEYDGNITISVADNTYTDADGNNGTGDSLIIESSTDTPALTISTSDSDLTAGETATITFTFSEAVIGFTDSDISVSGGSLGSIATSDGGITYTATFTPDAETDGMATISVVDSSFTDSDGNNGTGDSLNIELSTDTTSLAITTSDADLTVGETATITFTFSEPVLGFSDGDISVSGGSLGAISTSDGGVTYTATLTPNTEYDGNITISVADDTYTDADGNNGTGDSIIIESSTDTTTLTISSDDTNLVAGEAATITFTFSEAASGFTDGDISVTGGSLGTISTLDGGVTYTATLTPDAEYDGNITISVADNTYTDADGNNGTGDSLIIESSTDTPTLNITSDDANLVAGETATITFTFSEAATGFVDGDISVTGGSLGAISTLDGGVTYTAALTPDAEYDGNINISVADNTYTDADGNNGTGDSLIVESSTDTPTLNITSNDANLVAGETATITFTFSEAATGFADGDISVTGGSLGVISTLDGGVTYTATLTPDAEFDGNITISVADNTYTDADGNNGTGDSLIVESSTDTPTLTISSDDANLVAGETATITFTFSEAASGFTDGDISVTGGSLGAISTLDGGVTYTATLTPDAEYDGNITISVADNTYTDADGNNGTGDSLIIESSTDTPTLTISSDDANLVAGETATITFTFSEAASGFVDGDISVTGGSLGAISTLDGGVTYTATLTPDAEYDGNITISVADNTYTDADGNNGTGDSLIVESSTDTPTLTISSDDTNIVVGETATITFTFSEAATGFVDGDISVSGGSLGAISTLDGGVTYTATLTPDAEYDGNITISVADNTYTDADGNNGTGDSLIIESSTDTPTLTISSDDANLVAGETATITFTFSEAASGFVDGGISVTGGSLGAISTLDGGVTYTATLTPDAEYDGNITISVADNTYTDADGNNGTGDSLVIESSTDTPTLTITSDDANLVAGDTATITFTFSEAASGFTGGDISVSGGSLGAISTLDGGVTYTATLTPDTEYDGNITISVADNTYTDADGNNGSGDSLIVESSTVTPTLTISSDDANLVAGETATITFTFSEAATGFVDGDISVSGGSLGAISTLDGGVTYTATLTPDAEFDGNITISVADNTYTDADGNNGTGDSLIIESSTDTPTLNITSNDANLVAGETATITFTFSEAATGFVDGDISVSGGSLGAISTLDGGVTYTATLTPDAEYDGNITISVADNTYTDADGNNGTGDSLIVESSTDTPTLNITSNDANLVEGETATITFTFSEAASGFTDGDISVSGGSLGAISTLDGGVTYTATLTPDAEYDGNITISVADNTYTDADGNNGTGDSLIVESSTDTPTLNITSNDANLVAGETATITFTFSEAASGFTDGDISVSGGSLGAISTLDGGVTYTATLTPDAEFDGNITISVADNTYTDADGNNGTGDSLIIESSTDTPTLNITSNDANLVAGETATITFTFSEAASGFVDGGISVTGGSLGAISTLDGGVTYTATLTPDAEYDGNITISVADNTYTDADGNNGTGDSLVIESSTDTPTLTITSDDANLVAGDTATITFTFSEAASGFTGGDISVSGGSLGAISTLDGGVTYTVTLTPDTEYDGNITISVADNTYTDADGNNGTGDSLIIESSTDTPTLTISSDDTNLVAGETATITFTFSEAASGFVDGDISVTGGSLGAISTLDGGVTYTATLTPDAEYDGNITISVADNTYTDADGNNGTGDSLIIESSTDTPTLTISSDDANLVAGETATITFTFSEAASGFVDGDISVTGGSLGAISTLDGGVTYTATLTPDAEYDGNITISVADNNYTDADGNNGTGDSLIIESSTDTPSIASISVADGTYGIGDSATITITADGLETGLSLNSATFNGQTLTSFNDLGDGTYTAVYTVVAGDNDYPDGASVATNISFVDSDGNVGPAVTSVTLSGESIDANAPVISNVSIPDSAMNIGDVVTVTITVHNDGGVTYTNVGGTIGGFALSNLNRTNSTTYTAQFTVTDGGTDVSAGSDIPVNVTVDDPSGNTSAAYTTAISQSNDAIDANAPTVASVSIVDGTYGIGDSMTLTITANNNEAGLTLSSATFNGQSLTGISDQGDGTYTATYTVQAGDTDVADGGNVVTNLAFTDSAGNTGAATTSVTLSGESIDGNISAPGISLHSDTGPSSSDGVTNDATVNVSLAADVDFWEYSVNGGSNWTTGTGTSFELADNTVFPNADIQVRQTDTSGNLSTVTTHNQEVTVDVDNPTVTSGQNFFYYENAAAGTVIGTVEGADNLSGITSWQFSNGTQTTTDGLYTINDSGVISLTAAGAAEPDNTDYETGANVFYHDVVAIDNAGNQSSNMTVNINLLNASVTIADIDKTTDTTPTISGISSGTSGDITVTVNGVNYVTTPDSDGNWSVTIPDGNALTAGTYTATVAVGNADTGGDSMSFDVVAGSDIGASTDDGIGTYTIDGWDVGVTAYQALDNTTVDYTRATSDYLHVQTINLSEYNNTSGVLGSGWSIGDGRGGFGDFGDGVGTYQEWVIYENIQFGVAGNYSFTFEIATTFNFQARVDLNSGAQVIGYTPYVNTGDWDTYQEVTVTGGSISAGNHNVGLNAWDDGGGAANMQGMTITHENERDFDIYTGAGRDYVSGGTDADTIYLGDTEQADGATYDDGVVDQTAAQLAAFNFMTETEANAYLQIEEADTQNTSVADVADGNAGDDIIYGEQGTDIIYGNLGADAIYGGLGRDALRGGAGDDALYGGAGADVLRGDTGADTFYWLAGDHAQPDSVDTTETDIILDFNTGEGDVIDLSSLLQGESETALSLDDYLDFEKDGSDTIINIDVDGDGSGTDWSIRLDGVDLGADVNSDQTIISTLLGSNSLNTD